MQKLLLTICAVLLSVGVVGAQSSGTEKGYALIFPKTGDGYSANILRVEKDSIIIFTSELRYVAKKDIGKITTRIPIQTGGGFVIGSTLGTYAANYLWGTAQGQPAPFLASSIYGSGGNNGGGLSFAGIILMGVLIGGGIGHLTDAPPITNHSETYLFGVNESETANQWEKLSSLVENRKSKPKIHLSISGGYVIANTRTGLSAQLTPSGYGVDDNYGNSFPVGSYSERTELATSFNWMRTVAASYSVTDNIRVGAALARISEPLATFTKQQDSPAQSDSDRYYRVQNEQNSTGYFLTGSYLRQFGKAKDFEASVTGGIGYIYSNVLLKTDYATRFNNYSAQIISSSQFYEEKNGIGAMIGAEVSYYLYDKFSFGLSGRYFLSGSTTAPAMPLIGLEEQKINFGNGDIGFTIGIHF